MSLAEELLADLYEVGGELDDEDVKEEEIMEADQQLEELVKQADQSVKAVAKLNDSEMLQEIMEKVEHYLENPDSNTFVGPVEVNPEYQLIVESNNIVVEIDNEIYTVHKYVKDKYSKRFPELDSMVHTPLEYVKAVKLLQNDLEVTKVDLTDILPAATIMVVSVTASTTQGQLLEEDELQIILEACDVGLVLNDKKFRILQYVESRMSYVAPNLSVILGSTVAAKIMGVAGGLTALSKMPACNIQVLGAQKRTLAGFSTVSVIPHIGFVFYCEIVQSTPDEFKRKAAKLIASKCALAARVDSFHQSPNGEIGEELRKEVQKKVEKLVEPPPVKRVKPLPRPDDLPKKRRGGKRVRRMKQKFFLTELRKQASRMSFGQIEQDAYQDDLGFSLGSLGKGGVSGPVRGPVAADKKTQISISKRLQRQIQKHQVYGGKSSIRGATSGTASTIAFTPLQGLEIVNPMAAEKRIQEVNQKYFSAMAEFQSTKTKDESSKNS